ncbi:MAG: TraR/DksA C4-type zinc finger protein [Chloroflexi bacterium]|nr:TraR/DksA C4-type zinc finger protein [Chloroflexota bacterium]
MPIPYDRLKNALLAEQATLIEQLQQLNVVVKEEGVGYSTHPADDGTLAFDQARDLAVRVNAEQTLRLVEDALARFDTGTYGLCVDCGTEIDAARLEAIPYAALCLKCQSKREHR